MQPDKRKRIRQTYEHKGEETEKQRGKQTDI